MAIHTEDFEGSQDIHWNLISSDLSILFKWPQMTLYDPKMTLNLKRKNADNVFLKEDVLLNTFNALVEN